MDAGGAWPCPCGCGRVNTTNRILLYAEQIRMVFTLTGLLLAQGSSLESLKKLNYKNRSETSCGVMDKVQRKGCVVVVKVNGYKLGRRSVCGVETRLYHKTLRMNAPGVHRIITINPRIMSWLISPPMLSHSRRCIPSTVSVLLISLLNSSP